MVRLEVRDKGLLPKRVQNFNSSMVRLEEFGHFPDFRSLVHFNSSMVRLEVDITVTKAVILFNFNSSMVRLEGCSRFLLFKKGCNFNSSMVRLEVRA